MTEILLMLKQLGTFTASFGLMKCFKSMIAATGMLLLILLLHFVTQHKTVRLRLFSFFLLFPMCMMGYSRLYFHGPLIRISTWMYQYLRPWCGFLYFGVAAVLLTRFFRQNRAVNRMVQRLPNAEQNISKILADLAPDRRLSAYLSRIKIYRTNERISPYSGGILHPYIVLPDTMLKNWTSQDIHVILLHEILHIRYGHILFLSLFSILKIYWWINPLFAFAEKKLREDMELFCDERCLYYSRTDSKNYGNLLLQTIYLVQDLPQKNVAAFFQKESFSLLKNRISYLKRYHQKNLKQEKPLSAFFLGLSLVFICLIQSTSYPRYTQTTEVSLHDETGRLLLYDTPALREAVQADREKASVDSDSIKSILRELDIQKNCVYLCYGTIQKTPGTGGCGNVILVDLEEGGEIQYLESDDWKNRLEVFFIKYLI